jgi:lactoylglutathione lyase
MADAIHLCQFSNLWLRNSFIPGIEYPTWIKLLRSIRTYLVSKRSPRGSELVFFKAPGSEEEIEICKFDASGPVNVGSDITHLAFEVDDIEAFAKHSASKGYPLSDGPTETGGGSVIAFVDAPEGYEIELIQHAK